MDIEALKIIQEEECEAFKVFKQDYSSSEASSSESESEGISYIDCVDSYSLDDSSINIVFLQHVQNLIVLCLHILLHKNL